MTNSRSITFVFLIGFVVFALFLFYGMRSAEFVRAAVGGPGEVAYIDRTTAPGSIAGQPNATTSVAYLTVGQTASTTVIGQMLNASKINLQVQSMGSTSAATLTYATDFSNNYNPATGNGDWYTGDYATTSAPVAGIDGRILHANQGIENVWSVATTSAQGNFIRKQFLINGGHQAKYFRIRFGTSGANQSVWAAATPYEEVPR